MDTSSAKKKETYNIVAAHGYFGRLIFQYASLTTAVVSTSSWLPGLLLASGLLLLVLAPWLST